MPLGPGVRYRRKGDVRLAFQGGQVIEAKNMKTGAVHTPSEFAADRRAKKRASPRAQRIASARISRRRSAPRAQRSYAAQVAGAMKGA